MFVLRTSGDPRSVIAGLRLIGAQIDPAVGVQNTPANRKMAALS